MQLPPNEEVNSAILDALSIANEQGVRAGFMVNTARGTVVGTVFPNDGENQNPVLPQAVKDGAVGNSLAIQKALRRLNVQSPAELMADQPPAPPPQALPPPPALGDMVSSGVNAVIAQFNQEQTSKRATMSEKPAVTANGSSTITDIDTGLPAELNHAMLCPPNLLARTASGLRDSRQRATIQNGRGPRGTNVLGGPSFSLPPSANQSFSHPGVKASSIIDMRPKESPPKEETRDAILQLMQSKMKGLPQLKAQPQGTRSTIALGENSRQLGATPSQQSLTSQTMVTAMPQKVNSFSSTSSSRTCSPAPSRAMQYARASMQPDNLRKSSSSSSVHSLRAVPSGSSFTTTATQGSHTTPRLQRTASASGYPSARLAPSGIASSGSRVAPSGIASSGSFAGPSQRCFAPAGFTSRDRTESPGRILYAVPGGGFRTPDGVSSVGGMAAPNQQPDMQAMAAKLRLVLNQM